MDLRVRDQAVNALFAGASAAVDLLSKLPGSPKIAIYIWDEFDPTGRDPSEEVKEKLERLYGKSDNVLVLSQFLYSYASRAAASARRQSQSVSSGRRTCATIARFRRPARAATSPSGGRRRPSVS